MKVKRIPHGQTGLFTLYNIDPGINANGSESQFKDLNCIKVMFANTTDLYIFLKLLSNRISYKTMQERSGLFFINPCYVFRKSFKRSVF